MTEGRLLTMIVDKLEDAYQVIDELLGAMDKANQKIADLNTAFDDHVRQQDIRQDEFYDHIRHLEED